MIEDWPNILIITGEGRNSGKTSLACEIIRQHRQKNNITGIKVSPHWHPVSPGSQVLFRHDDYIVIDEKESRNGKDSGKMLMAGAGRVYYIQTSDAYIKAAFNKLRLHISHNEPIICESAGLLQIINPGLHIHIRKEDPSSKNTLRSVPDLLLGKEDRFSSIAGRLHFSNKKGWTVA